MSNGILLDTHIWLWHLNAETSLSNKIKKIIDQSASENKLYLSAISIWEIAMLVKKRRITLQTSCQAWVNKSLSLPGISLIPLSPEIAIESCDLEGNFHGDPADRIIVASVKVENISLITRDEKLISYCHQYHIEVMSA